MRDELSHNVFLMLQECNKFREHQARELLIELLEQQLSARQSLITELDSRIERAEELLHGTNGNSSNNIPPVAVKQEEDQS